MEVVCAIMVTSMPGSLLYILLHIAGLIVCAALSAIVRAHSYIICNTHTKRIIFFPVDLHALCRMVLY